MSAKKVTAYAVRDARGLTLYTPAISARLASEMARLMGYTAPLMVRRAFRSETYAFAAGVDAGVVAAKAAALPVSQLGIRGRIR